MYLGSGKPMIKKMIDNNKIKIASIHPMVTG